MRSRPVERFRFQEATVRSKAFTRPTSSWRWDTFEQFSEHVQPLHINEVDYVRNAWVVFAWSNSLKQYFESLDAFSTATYAANSQAESKKGLAELCVPWNEHLIDIGHYGEMILLYRKRLAMAPEADDFIYNKQFIQHAAHELGRQSRPHEIKQLLESASKFLDFIMVDRTLADEFIVNRVRDIPLHLRDDFRSARDLFSVGFDDAALFSAGRGLERICREILRSRKISLKRKGDVNPAHQENLYDIVEILSRLRWKTDSELLLSSSTKRLLHWIRDLRNESAHANMLQETDAYELVPVIADSSAALWNRHIKNSKRKLLSTEIEKNWQ